MRISDWSSDVCSSDLYSGPYHLRLSIAETRLQLDIRDEDGQRLDSVALPLLPFRRVIRDYFSVCESYYEAIQTASPARSEAIDMGRRGQTNAGSELLRERERKDEGGGTGGTGRVEVGGRRD